MVIVAFLFIIVAFMSSFNLKRECPHIEIFEGRQTYLGFSWKLGSSKFTFKFYVFIVLPFGLSFARHVFTKTLKTLENIGVIRAYALLVSLTIARP